VSEVWWDDDEDPLRGSDEGPACPGRKESRLDAIERTHEHCRAGAVGDAVRAESSGQEVDPKTGPAELV
jgi:hypothetical protein